MNRRKGRKYEQENLEGAGLAVCMLALAAPARHGGDDYAYGHG